ncbi:MAG: hypothetical protein ACI92E_002822 [Oceanicoccus sp.]
MDVEDCAISDFELNTVIVSILIAFALSEILSSWGRIVQSRDRVVRPGLYLAGSGWIFLSLILHWLGVSVFRDLEFERIYQSLLFFFPSILAAAAAFILTPTLPEDGRIDLEEHYFSVAPWAFGCAAAYTTIAYVSDFLVPGEQTTPALISLTLTTGLLVLATTKRPKLHGLVLSVLGAILLTSVVFGTR